MTQRVTFFGSLQSPYCYFALDRLDALVRDHGVEVVMRPVLPGVIRIPDAYADRGPKEQAYFSLDAVRTAAFLGLPYAEPAPSPVNWMPGSLWIATDEQARIKRLYNMLWQVRGPDQYALYSALMRRIWSGQHPGWDQPEQIGALLSGCGLPEALADQPDELLPEAEGYFAENQKAMFNAGHWGVPLFEYQGQPFYGQDRLDQLCWAIRQVQTANAL
ncbi:MAG: 2-hydroxychromene-2-carboxylate isomerase [Leisingera sp.]